MSNFTVSVNGTDFNVNVEEKTSTGFVQTKDWRDPEPHELETLWFNKIWNVIKDWDINVPVSHKHVICILDAIVPPLKIEDDQL